MRKNSKPELIIMIGIPGSGKSTYAEEKRDSHTIVSTDSIRQELCGDYSDQSQNNAVFNLFYARIAKSLRSGENVVADATNLTIKHRRSIFRCAEGVDCKFVGVVVISQFETCVQNDANREKPVGEKIIKKSVLRFMQPLKNEGFDDIVYHVNSVDFQDERYLYSLMDGFPQDSKFHDLDLGKHCLVTKELLMPMSCNRNFLCAAGIHDIGKVFTKAVDNTGEAHYYGHANYGAYHILSKCYGLGSFEDVIEIAFYVNYHMLPFDWKQKKTHEKYKKLLGEEAYKNLILLHKSDMLACSEESLKWL